jgi:hypothetical protein
MYQTQVLTKMIQGNLLARASPDEKTKILDQAKKDNTDMSSKLGNGRESIISGRLSQQSPLGIIIKRSLSKGLKG